MQRARTAQRAWRRIPVKDRCVFLSRLRREIAQDCESISAAIARDAAKPLLDALSGDVLVVLEQIRYYERQAATILQSKRNGKPSFFFRKSQFETHFEPYGVVLVCGPANYPFQLAMIPLITALVAGNAVLLKCSEHAPETAILIETLCSKAGFPKDLVQVSHGGPEEAKAFLDARPDLVFFTGSSQHGRMVAERAAHHLIPCVLELGGKDASLVFEDCPLERAVEGIAYGAYSNAGRVCVAVKRAYVHESIMDDFVARLRARISRIRVGNEPDSDYCPLPAAAISSHHELVHDALNRGATLLHPRESELGSSPVLLTGVPSDARLLTEESFGPVLIVESFRDEAHAITLANESPFALSSSVWTRSKARGRRVASQLSAGSCAVNDIIRVIANPGAAFGGNRSSGYGRYHGAEGLRSFSRIKTVMHCEDQSANQVNWFPLTSQTRMRLTKLIQIRHGLTGLIARLLRLLPLLLLALLLPFCSAEQSAPPQRLTVEVNLTAKASGELGYLVFASPAGFPNLTVDSIRHGFLAIPSHAERMTFSVDLPPGTYAVAVYDDLNGNHKLDHNLIGIPREPVGASNNPQGRFGPPRFAQCSFHLGDSAKAITINLVKGL